VYDRYIQRNKTTKELQMFSSAIAAVVLASSIAMPATLGNPWAENNWQPLQDRYEICREESLSALEYYECTSYWYDVATAHTVNA
jgi:hypothetical protein